MVGLAHEDHVIGRVGAALGKRHDMMDLVAFGHAVEAVDGEDVPIDIVFYKHSS